MTRRFRAVALAGLGIALASTTACGTTLANTTRPEDIVTGPGYHRLRTPQPVPTAPVVVPYPESTVDRPTL